MMMSARLQLQEIARDAMRARGFAAEFSPVVLEETSRLSNVPPPTNRRDLRHLLWTSIDNDDSLDLDQLTVAESLATDSTRILIAIADVDALVAAGTAIDQRAAFNTTSVYTAAAVFPMLPERLSTDLTSLDPDQDRAALVVQMDIAVNGAVTRSEIYPALVRNRAQLAYGSVGEWFDGHRPAPGRVMSIPGLADNLRQQDRVAQTLRRGRREQGALTLSTREVRPIFDGDTVQDLAEEHQNRAKELIEEFMIAANTATASFLSTARMPSIRRVVRTPKRWDRIVALAARSGARLPASPDSQAMAAWLVERQTEDPQTFRDLSLSVVKLIGRGEYVLQRPEALPVGHFGLALQDYTHATAPNRRFADLVTQRLLKASLADRPAPYSSDALGPIAQRCTERESAADAVERQVRKSAAALLLTKRIGEVFNALVTGVNATGTWVRLTQPPAEGRLEEGFTGVDVGDQIRVRLLRTDVRRGFLDFGRA
jgi:VacB/RNase II family 3'-5' exoribonuclease